MWKSRHLGGKTNISDLSFASDLHVLVDLLPAALVLQAGLGQVDWKHTGDSY